MQAAPLARNVAHTGIIRMSDLCSAARHCLATDTRQRMCSSQCPPSDGDKPDPTASADAEGQR
jgi:hypothetical protein